MTTIKTLGFSAILCVLAACGGSEVAGNNSNSHQPVPGTRATEGDLCDREYEYGNPCVRVGDHCADGGNAPASYQCVFGTWRCVPDNRVTTCRRETQPTDPPPVHPRGHVTVTCGGPAMGEVLTNSGNANVRSMRLAVQGREVEARRIPARIAWSTYGLTHHVSGESGTRYFRDLQVRGEDTRILMPAVQFIPSANRQSGTTTLRGSVAIPAGGQRVLNFEVGVASFEEAYHELTSGWFALDFGGENPRTIFGENDLIYTDSGESVPDSDIEYDASCFEEVRNHQFRVIPRFADLIADRGRLTVSSTVNGSASGVAMIDMAVVNDGYEGGTMSGFTLDVNARANGSLNIYFRPMTTRCDLMTVDGRNVGYGTIRDTQVDFTNTNAYVPGNSIGHFIVRCDLVFPTEVARAMSAEWYEIRVGALYQSFQMRTDGDPGRIQGTLLLDQNRLSSMTDAVTVTLRPFSG